MRGGGWRLRSIQVVLAYIKHWQLPGCRNVEAFVERPRVGCTVAKERDCHATLSFHLCRQSRAGHYRDAASDNAIGTKHADVEVGDVHRPALALAIAGLPSIELSHHAVQVCALRNAM